MVAREGEPSISVIVVGDRGFAVLHAIIACLAEQTIAHEIELLAVVPTDEEPPEGSETHFARFRAVAAGPITNRGRAAAAGVRLARAPVIAFTENHCFPEPDWAEALVAAHVAAGRPAGVAPAILNANPETLISWAGYAIAYARFHPGRPAGEIEDMPLHNTTYRRDLLMVRDNRLEELLAVESALQKDLRAAGERFLFEPRARAYHVNEVPFGLIVAALFSTGWRYGGNRGRRWWWPRRATYALVFPFLSIPITYNLLRQLIPVADAPRLSPSLIARVWLISVLHALGEAAGYALGPREHFPALEADEFTFVERLDGIAPSNPRIARYAQQMRTPEAGS